MSERSHNPYRAPKHDSNPPQYVTLNLNRDTHARVAIGQMPWKATPMYAKRVLSHLGVDDVHDVHPVFSGGQFTGLILLTIPWFLTQMFLNLHGNLFVNSAGDWATSPAYGFRAVSVELASEKNRDKYWELRRLLKLRSSDEWERPMQVPSLLL